MTIATKNGAIIVKDGKLAENCGCCCRCFGPFCCNASDEMFATISTDSIFHTWEFKAGGPTNPLYIINMELELQAMSGTYTLENVSQSLPCGTYYENEHPFRFGDEPPDWPTLPEIRLYTFIRSPPQTSTVQISFMSYQLAGKASFKQTNNRGIVTNEILNSPVIFAASTTVSAPLPLNDLRPCERWSSLGLMPMRCNVIAYGNEYFNYYQSFIDRGILDDWSPPLAAAVSVDV